MYNSGAQKSICLCDLTKGCRWSETAEPNNAMSSETVSFLALATTILCRFLIIPVRAKCPPHLLLIYLIAAKMVKLIIMRLCPLPTSFSPLSTKYIPQHQFTHSFKLRDVAGSRGDDYKITIFRYMTECLPLTFWSRNYFFLILAHLYIKCE